MKLMIASGEKMEIENGLGMDADDCIVKPFGRDELIIKLKALPE